MDVDAYLARIGATRETGLRDLHRLHQTAVPFENLSIHLGEPISLEPGDLFGKVVTRGRGGFCYELNGLFALLLESLGHEVARVGVRIADGPLFDHLALLVDDRWLADVGFGAHSTYPLRLGEREPQEDPGGRFTLADEPFGDIAVWKDGEAQYRLERRPRPLTDFAPACWWQQTWPGSHFRDKPVCSRIAGDGRITISGRTLIVTDGGGRVEKTLATDAELLAAYREHFGISLPRPPVLSGS